MLGLLERVFARRWAGAEAEQWYKAVPITVRRLVLSEPIPLVLPDANLMVLFSAKSACTSVVIWFLHHLGHAKAARDYAEWPHRYRIEVYYKSKLFRDAWKRRLRDYTVVKIVRDPFQRAASSYRHLVRHPAMDPAVGEFLGRSDLEENGLSFDEFLRFLEASDMNEVNPHYKVQHHVMENRLPVSHLINVSKQDLFAGLNDVERDVGLPVTDFSKLDWIHEAETGRGVPTYDSDEDLIARRFTRYDALKGPWPSPKALLSEAARARIARLYDVDIRSLARAGGLGL